MSGSGNILLLLIKRNDGTLFVPLAAYATAEPVASSDSHSGNGGQIFDGLKRAIKLGLLGLCALVLFAMVPLLYEFISYYDGLQDEVVARFSTMRWTIPSRIYSDSEIIYPGQRISDIGLTSASRGSIIIGSPPGTEVEARGDYSYDQKSKAA